MSDVKQVNERQRLMKIQYEKLPERCFMCGVVPFGHLSPCDCCNHYFCIDCIDKFNALCSILVERKLIAKGEELGYRKKIAGKMEINFFCLCNTSLRCNIFDTLGNPIHFTSDEQRIYSDFELRKATKTDEKKKS